MFCSSTESSSVVMIYIVRVLCTASVSGAFIAHTSCTSQIWLFYCTADTPAGTRMFILLHSQAILVLLILSKKCTGTPIDTVSVECSLGCHFSKYVQWDGGVYTHW